MIGNRPLSALDAQKVLGIPAGTVRSWYNRRSRTGLYAMGFDEKHNPMFFAADLLALRRGERLRDENGARLTGDPEHGHT